MLKKLFSYVGYPYICTIKQTQNTMTTTQIKEATLKGQQYENEVNEWFTLTSVDENIFCIVIDMEHRFYKNITSYSVRVKQLINRGF